MVGAIAPGMGALVFARERLCGSYVVRWCRRGTAQNVRFVDPRQNTKRWCSHEGYVVRWCWRGTAHAFLTQSEILSAHPLAVGNESMATKMSLSDRPVPLVASVQNSDFKKSSKARAAGFGPSASRSYSQKDPRVIRCPTMIHNWLRTRSPVRAGPRAVPAQGGVTATLARAGH